MTLLDPLSSESEDDEEDEHDEILHAILSSGNNIYPTIKPFLIKGNKRNSVKQYIEQTVPSYSEEEFRRQLSLP